MKAAGSGRAGRWGVSLRPLLLAGTPSRKPDQLSAGDTRAWWVGVPGSQVARAADCRLASLPDHTTHAWLLEVSLGLLPRKVPAPRAPSSIFQEQMSPTSPIRVPGAPWITPRDPCSHSPRTGHHLHLTLQLGKCFGPKSKAKRQRRQRLPRGEEECDVSAQPQPFQGSKFPESTFQDAPT